MRYKLNLDAALALSLGGMLPFEWRRGEPRWIFEKSMSRSLGCAELRLTCGPAKIKWSFDSLEIATGGRCRFRPPVRGWAE